MKKTLITLACAVITLTASAQRASHSQSSFFSKESSEQPVTVGIRGGVNLANISISDHGSSTSFDSHTGFNIGLVLDFPLMQSLYLQSGLYYTVKGSEYTEDSEYTTKRYKETINPSYLEIPILASYRYNFSDAAQLQINFGPYFAYGIGGKYKEEIGNREIETIECDFFGDEYDDSYGAKRFDAGLQIGAGITLARHYYLGVAYEFGFVNFSRSENDLSAKNKNFMINVGYQF